MIGGSALENEAGACACACASFWMMGRCQAKNPTNSDLRPASGSGAARSSGINVLSLGAQFDAKVGMPWVQPMNRILVHSVSSRNHHQKPCKGNNKKTYTITYRPSTIWGTLLMFGNTQGLDSKTGRVHVLNYWMNILSVAVFTAKFGSKHNLDGLPKLK